MKITDVRVRVFQNEDNKLKGVAAITIDGCFVVHDIKILEGQQGNYIKMPNRKTGDGRSTDVAHPINTATREEITSLILAKYEEEKANATEA